MGEAKRRKQAGTYPKPGDPVEAARKFWAGKGLTRVEDFRVPEGMIAITFDVEGTDPSTVVINPADYHLFVPTVETWTDGRPYYGVVQMLAKEFKRARQAGDDRSFSALPWLALWTGYNHPKNGQAMRDGVSSALRRNGKAHITWQFGSNGLAMGLADRFVDLQPLAELAPKDSVTAYVAPKEPESPMH